MTRFKKTGPHVIKTFAIRNYKSINDVTLDLGRINVFIGENGAGKSNILEAIALCGAATADKLDNEFLASRGIRVTQPEFMRSAFDVEHISRPISITVVDHRNMAADFKLDNDNAPYSSWTSTMNVNSSSMKASASDFRSIINEVMDGLNEQDKIEFTENLIKQLETSIKKIENKLKNKEKIDEREKISFTFPLTLALNSQRNYPKLEEKGISIEDISNLEDFIIYSPENSALRTFEKEGQIEPLGINGEGLLRLLTVMSHGEGKEIINQIKESLKIFGWFEDFSIDDGDESGRLRIRDSFIANDLPYFDQRSANEGFLFAAFYFTLFSSNLTPKFFAVDNIDASLNPKMCEKLVKSLVPLAKANEKQVILTTHNPATLDGLNLDDEDQRLFIVSRDRMGKTKVRRFQKRATEGAGYPVRLSEAFIRGSLGGLPKGF